MVMPAEAASDPMLAAALGYASRGWAVLPLHTPPPGGLSCSCGRADCTSPGKHPRLAHGLKEASTDSAQLAAWWGRWPNANIGVVTGARSGLLVLDVDPGHGGEDSLSKLVEANEPLPDTPVVLTGGGGTHFYLRHPGEEIRNNAGTKLGAGLDIRGDGGYVVAPPSLHASSRQYTWDGEPVIADPPEWLLVMLRKPQPRPRVVEPLPAAATAGRYGQRALELELAELAGAPEGGRNNALNTAAFNLAQLVGGGVLEQGLVEEELGRVAAAIGLAETETRLTIASGMAAGAASPRRAPERREPAARARRARPDGRGPSSGPPPDRPPATAGSFRLTDMGNAERLVARHGAKLRFCPALGTREMPGWYVWDGCRWQLDRTAEVERFAKESVRGIYAEASAADDSAERKEIAKWAHASEANARVQAMISLARSEPGIAVLPEELDRDPWLMNCLNGTVDLRTGELRPHRAEDMLTKLVPVTYDPRARSELWEGFLRDSTGGDDELAAFLQRLAGYSATGLVTEEKLTFIHGPAAAGKSTFMEALKAALGEYATTADFETFLARSQVGGPREDIARLAGSRLVVSIEVDEGKRLAEGLVKMITGGDTVTARHLYRGSFEFQPQFALWLVANHEPRVRADDEAMWRRIIRVPFEHVVPPERRDRSLKAKLTDRRGKALPAVLAWIVAGAVQWHRDGGLGEPASVRKATQDYRDRMDPLKGFLENCCVVTAAARVTSRELRDAYEAWCGESGERPISPNAFAARLVQLGCVDGRSRNGGSTRRVWQGIGLAIDPIQGSFGEDDE
jgi:putative DNA primase/helicase